MSDSVMKEVDFTYCLECKHWINKEHEEPCHECLNEPMNANSHKPVKFEQDEKKKGWLAAKT